jgi:hypothetical protein
MSRTLGMAILLLSLLPGPFHLRMARGVPREFLTPNEITKIQQTHEIDQRIRIYLEAAALRLKTAQERFAGKESAEGDPLEFFSVADMIGGYNRIMESITLNLDDAFQRSPKDADKLRSALSALKEAAEKAEKGLAILKKQAEEKLNEPVWNLVNQALEITQGAREGAESGIATLPEPPAKKKGGKSQPR